MHLMEPDVLFLRRGVELDGDRHQAERDRALPDRSHYRLLPTVSSVRSRMASLGPLRKVFERAYGDRVPGAPLSPMLATAGTLPRGPGWSYEFKWDGVRVLASFEGGSPRLFARSGTLVTAAYPEVSGLSLPPGSLLDGEMVVLDGAGRPSFTALAERMHVREPARAARLAVSLPVTYMIFDLLRYDGISLLDLPYATRRERLRGPRPARPAPGGPAPVSPR